MPYAQFGINIDMCAILQAIARKPMRTLNFKQLALVRLAEEGLVIIRKRTYLTKVGRKVAKALRTAEAYRTQENPYMG
jgi:hypothetical protein